MSTLGADLNELTGGINLIKSTLAANQAAPSAGKDNFQEVMSTFLKTAEPKVKALQEKLEATKKLLVEVLLFFGEPQNSECDAFFGLIASFIDIYDKARLDNQKKKELEEKKKSTPAASGPSALAVKKQAEEPKEEEKELGALDKILANLATSDGREARRSAKKKNRKKREKNRKFAITPRDKLTGLSDKLSPSSTSGSKSESEKTPRAPKSPNSSSRRKLEALDEKGEGAPSTSGVGGDPPRRERTRVSSSPVLRIRSESSNDLTEGSGSRKKRGTDKTISEEPDCHSHDAESASSRRKETSPNTSPALTPNSKTTKTTTTTTTTSTTTSPTKTNTKAMSESTSTANMDENDSTGTSNSDNNNRCPPITEPPQSPTHKEKVKKEKKKNTLSISLPSTSEVLAFLSPRKRGNSSAKHLNDEDKHLNDEDSA
eukprot:TRINITY_DN7606_c0_g1_i3.p1 TRINITY_DN7606_c0_g1~~TRINITY_DN7606_c0_g1_i3.p1  ORF type:complete len:431 (-),score=140.97 TRINITY_DN7606_c0_g1_i3:50-1342(-)